MKLSSLATSAALALALSGPAFAAPTDTEVLAINAARLEYANAKKAIEREDWNSALHSLQVAERHDPRSADVQNLLGYTLRQKDDFDGAVKHYQRALELNPYHRGAHEYLGRLYLHQNKMDQAKALLSRLNEMCTEKCPERDSLKQAIAEWAPWKPPVRGAKAY
jgi:Flp pilus assembly protein TadD